MKGCALIGCVLVIGCSASDSHLKTPSGMIAIQPPRILPPTRAIGWASSSNGKYYATLIPVGPKKVRFEVREWDGDRIVWQAADADEGFVLPLVFTLDGQGLIGVANGGVVRIDLGTGKRETIGSNPPGGFGRRNADQTIYIYDEARVVQDGKPVAGGGTRIVTASGKCFSSESMASFDMYGNAWTNEGKRWRCIEATGKVTLADKAPRGLVPDQMKVRGSLRLESTRREETFRGAKATITSIWLTGSNVLPLGPGDEGTKGSRAALVHACSDAGAYGFVPKRDEIFVISLQGTYIIPYKMESK